MQRYRAIEEELIARREIKLSNKQKEGSLRTTVQISTGPPERIVFKNTGSKENKLPPGAEASMPKS